MRTVRRMRKSQAGFSLMEMLMVALIMGIGLLGVASLQTVAIKATNGSANLATAAQIANRIMDQVEEEGRLCWLNQTASGVIATGTEPPNLYYLSHTPPFTLAAQGFDITGSALPAGTAHPIFQAVVSGTAVTTAGATVGKLVDVNVTVTFTDSVQGSRTLTRTLTLSRRIIYA